MNRPMNMKKLFAYVLLLALVSCNNPKTKPVTVTPEVMREIYEEIKTPYKYGLVMTGADADKMTDCPTIIRRDGKWYMYYFVFDGRGYETWLAESENLLDWTTTGTCTLLFGRKRLGLQPERRLHRLAQYPLGRRLFVGTVQR